MLLCGPTLEHARPGPDMSVHQQAPQRARRGRQGAPYTELDSGSARMRYQRSLRSSGNVGAYASTPLPSGGAESARACAVGPAMGKGARARSQLAEQQRGRTCPVADDRMQASARTHIGRGGAGCGDAPGRACEARVSVRHVAQVTMSFSAISSPSSPSTCPRTQRAQHPSQLHFLVSGPVLGYCLRQPHARKDLSPPRHSFFCLSGQCTTLRQLAALQTPLS